MSNEQWKEEGNCKKCRRANYCSKPCKVAKERLREAIRAKLAEKTGMDNFAEAIHKEFGISESDYILLHGLKEANNEKDN